MNTLNNFHRIKTTTFIPLTTRDFNSRTNDIKLPTSYLIERNEKDLIISNLRTRIYQLEQKEKELEEWKDKYNQLKKDFDDINNDINLAEIENKKKVNNFNSDIISLKNEKDSIKFKYSEILTKLKKAKAENDYLEKENEIKKKEIEKLNQNIIDLKNKLSEVTTINSKLDKYNKELNDCKVKHDSEKSKLFEDNCRLSTLCQELHDKLKIFEKENEKLSNDINNKNINLDELNKKLIEKEEKINHLTRQVNENKSIKDNQQKKLDDMNLKLDECINENGNLKNDLIKEQNNRIEVENKNKEFNSLLLNKEKELDELNIKYQDILDREKELNKDIKQNKIELEKYKDNCKILKEQNKNLMNEIQNVISMHERVQDKLNRSEKIQTLLENNKNAIQQSLLSLDNDFYKELDSNIYN